jgi:hypothetical protein
MTPTTERTAAEVAALHARLDRLRQQTARNGEEVIDLDPLTDPS